MKKEFFTLILCFGGIALSGSGQSGKPESDIYLIDTIVDVPVSIGELLIKRNSTVNEVSKARQEYFVADTLKPDK